MNKLVTLFVLILSPILLAEVQMTPQQQEAANKLTAKGGLVIPLAADADSVVVSLNMAGKQATDADLAELKNLPKISQLNLANTAVTDAGLANIAGLTNLTHLHLEKTAISDAGLVHLKNLTNLVYLNLYFTNVTDAGLANLSGLTNLKRLYVWQSKVTEEGKKNLNKSLPNLVINAAAPFAINMLARPYMSTIDALLLASSVPALWTLGGVIWKKRLDMIGMLVVVSLLLTAVFALLYALPWLDRRFISRDYRRHDLLELPRENPRRTALAAAVFSAIAIVFAAGSADRLFFQFGFGYEGAIWFFRGAFLLAPPLVYWITRRVCLALLRAHAHPLRGFSGAVVVRGEQGGFERTGGP